MPTPSRSSRIAGLSATRSTAVLASPPSGSADIRHIATSSSLTYKMPLSSSTTQPSVCESKVISRTSSARRSEEHTSELQSLMRISYAVFCLKKKKQKHQHTTKNTKNTKQIYTLNRQSTH